ncbi:hypothetical protein NliqN6_3276 [Naganishia liquefaciens]|uniref:Asl1-like glycosyl hydrolase catalytic domain-containing protein n=1 Tax=Naganishia liquefaciens TaxID=104408 RepID=A0A8H3YEU7_9TREE|nr:hypothetical protein NliqN6_3276 [Naganishia liquefaciens]
MLTSIVRVMALAAPLTTTLLGAVTLNANGVSAASRHAPAHNRRSSQHARLASAQQAKRSNGGKKLRRRGDGKACKIRSTDQSSIAQDSAPTAASSAWSEPSSTPAANAWVNTADAASAAPTSTYEAPASSDAPAASSTSSQAAVVTSTPGSGDSDGAFGLAWPNGDWDAEGQPGWIGQYASGAHWYYTWSPHGCQKADELGLEFVPMIWGAKDCNDDFWNAANSWPSSVKHVLFFNEPNEISQSNISPEDAVQYWKQYMTPLGEKGYKLGMAAPTNAPSGLEWVKKFVELCPECHYDFQPLHWYDVNAEGFKEYIDSFYQATGKPIWVTEYACQSFNWGTPQCSSDQTWALHQEMAKWFDANPNVERYSPFGAMRQMQGVNEDNRLMDVNGWITSLGDWYVNSA